MKRLIILVMAVFIYGCATTNYSPSYSSSSSYYPTYKDFKYYFDRAYYSNEPDTKIEYYTKAIENWKWSDTKENLAVAYYNRGLVYGEKGEYDKEMEDYNKAIELKPDLAEAYINRGIVYSDKGEYDKAIEDYNKAIELKPDLAEAYIGRGWYRFDTKEYNLAISDFEKAISLKEEFDAYLGLSLVYMKTKKLTKSKEYFEKAVKLEPLLNKGMKGIPEIEKKGYWYSENQKQSLRKLFNMFLKNNKNQE